LSEDHQTLQVITATKCFALTWDCPTPVPRFTTADETENLTSDADSWSSSRSAVATTLRRGVSTLHCLGRGLIMCCVRQGAGEGGTGVGNGLGTNVSLTVAFKMKSYEATCALITSTPVRCDFTWISAAITTHLWLTGTSKTSAVWSHYCLYLVAKQWAWLQVQRLVMWCLSQYGT